MTLKNKIVGISVLPVVLLELISLLLTLTVVKGSYNISKSENLVDKIKENSGMDVTFFYGDQRIMTSATDSNGDRILGSPAGETIVKKVLEGNE